MELGEGPLLPNERLAALDEALQSLEQIDQRKSRVVELRFFGRLSVEEVLEISPATVKREWQVARAWLFRELNVGDDRGKE